MEQSNMNPFDLNAIIEAQKRNIETFSQARTAILEGFQALMQRQTDTLLHAVDNASSFMKTGNLQNCLAWNADMVEKNSDDFAARGRKVAGLIGKAGKETSDSLRKHDVPALRRNKGKNQGNHVHQKQAA